MKPLLVSALLLLLCQSGLTQETNKKKDTIHNLKEITVNSDVIVGSKFKAKNRAGSTSFISPADLKTFHYADVSRILAKIPGVTVQEEDGFGLRPNIGMRGTNPNRSEKITLMEDGILIAPAPYAAPAAYYFPTTTRMQAFEIIKGGSQIQYGPYTTSGAINMVSSQIPSKFTGNFTATYGNYNTKRTYMNIGDNYKNFAYLVEYNNRNSDGFKKIDYSSKKTGFEGNDYVAKFRINTDFDAKIYQSLTVKLQYSEDKDNETYLGLTDADFKADPYRRYLGSNEDNIDTEHFQMMATHYIKPIKNVSFTTKAYRNTFARNWYKLDGVNLGTSTVSINNILENPVKYTAEYNAITGASNTIANALRVKANNREYEAQGIQTVGNFKLEKNAFTHEIEFGIRYHEDYEDRFQWVDGFAVNNKVLNRTNAGIPGTDANRITSATAIASHILYNLSYDKFTVSPGIRYENIDLKSLDYGKSDINRTGANLITEKNNVGVWIPGIGILYDINQFYNVFASIHKGFSPPGAKAGEDAENSINTEIGFRMHKNAFSGEIIYYYNNFSNLQGSDNMSGGGSGTGDLFNAGEAVVNGIELAATYDFLYNNTNQFRLPITLSYTYTDTELESTFSSPIWGNVVPGDEIPYIPKNQISIMADFEFNKFQFAMGYRFVDAFRTKAGQGTIPENYKVDSYSVFDTSAKYFLSKKVSFMVNVINLFDAENAVSRVPAGLRPAHPFGINAGISAHF